MLGCKPGNVDFNPFDNEFKFHRNFNLVEYDTIMGECGYWNLTKTENGLNVYYQFFLDETPIVAKGFDLKFDEISIFDEDSLENQDYLLNIIKRHPLNPDSIKNRLASLKIKDVKVYAPMELATLVEITDMRDSVYTASLEVYFDGKVITRNLNYFNGKGYD